MGDSIYGFRPARPLTVGTDLTHEDSMFLCTFLQVERFLRE